MSETRVRRVFLCADGTSFEMEVYPGDEMVRLPPRHRGTIGGRVVPRIFRRHHIESRGAALDWRCFVFVQVVD